ncbi:hypothetical protein G7Y79_00005g016230 [Physcia stellaris]|nr:hypothetical protein G7Y79_00005g016230 [Physcia stellaris]
MDSIIKSSTTKEEVIGYLFMLQLFSAVASLAQNIATLQEDPQTGAENIMMPRDTDTNGIALEESVSHEEIVDHSGTPVEDCEEHQPNRTSAVTQKVSERSASHPTLAISQTLDEQISHLSLGTSQSPLESLPVEIQIMILHELSNTRDLSAIVHASPLIHTTYLSTREESYTYVTLNELASRGVDVLSSFSILEVRTTCGGEPSDRLRSALLKLHEFQYRSEAPSGRIQKLDIDECLALQDLHDIVKWEVVIDESTRERNVSFFSDPLDNFLYWQEHDSYHVIALGKYACIEHEFLDLVSAEWLAEEEPGLSEEKRRRRDKMRLRRELYEDRRDSGSSSGSNEDD